MKKRNMAVKAMAGMMGAALLISAPVYAANEPEQKTMDVYYEVGSTYTLSIPEKITLNDQSGGEANFGVEKTNMQPGEVLSIEITTDHALLKREGDALDLEKKVSSVITVDRQPVTGASAENPLIIAEYEGIIEEPTENHTITFAEPEDADGSGTIEAGTYYGTVNFIASIYISR